MTQDPRKCPNCHTLLTAYPTYGFSQCSECGFIKDHGKRTMEETLPLDVLIDQSPAAWERILTACENQPKGRT
jgi:ribosomal protein S27AE